MNSNDIPTFGEIVEVDEFAPWTGIIKKRNEDMTLYQGTPSDSVDLTPQTIPEIQQKTLEEYKKQQSGKGIEDILDNARKLIKMADEIQDIAFGSVGTDISNTLSEYANKNPMWRPGFAGEKHIILPTDYGLTRANYAGPGTNLNTRLRRGDVGVDGPLGIDNAAKKHDIAYAKANSYDDIKKADEQFIIDVEKSTQKPAVKKAVISAIKVKNLGEKVGIIKKDKYIDKKGSGISRIAKGAYNPLSKEKKLTPAEMLLKKYRKKN